MATIDDLNKLKKAVEAATANAARAAGALDQTMARLKEEYSCDSIAAAEAKLLKLEQDAKKAEAKFTAAYQKFQDDFKEIS